MHQILFLFLCVFYVQAMYEGESCVKENQAGICRNIRNCQSALADIKNRKSPQICSFDNTDPIVCCLDDAAPVKPTEPPTPVATTPPRPSSTTAYVPPTYDYTDNNGNEECEPLSPSLTSPKTGQKAWDKCLEYQEKLVYPCEKGVALTGDLARGSHCHHNADELIIGGEDAAKNEFPHMALLGFGELPNVQWLCGGALISDKFILTAGHCIASRDSGSVSYAVVGALRRTDIDNTRRYKIKNIIQHPQFESPKKYNDIALLETETLVKLDQFVVPACLHVGDVVKEGKAIAAGWGLTEYGGAVSNTLQKVTLQKFTQEECQIKYKPNRLMKQGVNSSTQVCYGDKTASKDTCQGDSGGPLQIPSQKINCMYTIIGVTSFGKACGFVGEPGIYTKVAQYVPWIESVVWP